MLDFLGMVGNYDNRKVSRDDYSWGFISTISVTDGRKDFETAVEHKEYNQGSMIIVDCYSTKKKAEKGHKKWVKTMENPPDTLEDCANASVAQVIGKQVFKRSV